MPEKRDQTNDDDRPKKFRITRKRLGKIRFVDPKGEYGFIEAEDFRDDVFFHHTTWQPRSDEASGPLSSKTGASDGARENARHDGQQSGPFRKKNSGQAQKLVPEELVNKNVEFEIDDELFESEQRLRATIVRPTRRPLGRKLSGRDATFKIVTHHPRARRKRPDWRK